MKQPRPYPVYAVTPKAERSLTAGHPWVYGEEIIREPERAGGNAGERRPGGRGQPPGELSGHRPAQPPQQDPHPAPQPQRQRPL